MLRYALLSVIFIFSNTWTSHCLQADYYWRDYTGPIPPDAVIGGQDINGKNVYIGQAFVRKEGPLVAQIFPKVKEVYVPDRTGVKRIDTNIKILCGPQENFYWASVNSTHLNQQLIGKQAVIGGFEANGELDGLLNIGRTTQENELKIGKVTPYLPENHWHLYFPHKGQVLRVSSYEILLYNNFNFDLRSKSVL